MLNDKDAVRTQLDTLAYELESNDKQGAARLRELSGAVGNGQYADAWGACNIHELINVDAIVRRYQTQQQTEKWVTVVELLRNVLIFLPLTVTWFGIFRAVPAYQNYIVHNPSRNTDPFLLLWQQGFGGQLPFVETLAGIALIDFIILLIVFVLTALVSWFSGWSRLQREQKAEFLRDDLLHALAGAALCLATRNWSQPTNFADRFDKMIVRFDQVVVELVEQLKEERAQLALLAEQQKEELTLFGAFKSTLTSSMGGISSAIDDLQESNKTLSETVNQLVMPTQQLVTQQKTLLTNAEETINLLDRQALAQEAVVREQQLWGKELQNVLQMLDGTARLGKDLAVNISDFTTKQTSFLEAIKFEREEQIQLVARMIATTTTLDKISMEMHQTSTDMNGVAVNMGEIVRRIATKIPV